jgi:hypothetical protein
MDSGDLCSTCTSNENMLTSPLFERNLTRRGDSAPLARPALEENRILKEAFRAATARNGFMARCGSGHRGEWTRDGRFRYWKG